MSDQLTFEQHEGLEVEQLESLLGASWPAIRKARTAAVEQHVRLTSALSDLVEPSTSLVVFGSLARREWTSGSDLDWALLLDGPADPKHHTCSRAIAGRLRELKVTKPGDTGAFGETTSSHDLIHKIGGLDDTNVNLTQRNLLLLESVSIGSREAHQSVIRNVLRRYVEEDLGNSRESPYRVPRFLLNDMARYWRTLAVDFAQKRRDREGAKWAIRVAKLRMSRKLIFAAGLMTCYSCVTRLGQQRGEPQPVGIIRVVQHLQDMVGKTPLDILAGVVLDYQQALSATARTLFAAYDAFLSVLDDPQKREHLKGLRPEDAERDEVYRSVHATSLEFQAALTEMFFEAGDTPIPELTRKYGVF